MLICISIWCFKNDETEWHGALVDPEDHETAIYNTLGEHSSPDTVLKELSSALEHLFVSESRDVRGNPFAVPSKKQIDIHAKGEGKSAQNGAVFTND